jgi:hypothetical protein
MVALLGSKERKEIIFYAVIISFANKRPRLQSKSSWREETVRIREKE